MDSTKQLEHYSRDYEEPKADKLKQILCNYV
jgi:hypothetical protein